MTPSGRLPAFIRSAVVFLAAYTFAFLVASEAAVRLSVREFLDRAREIGPEHTVELQGTVTALWGTDAFFLQDGDAGVFALRDGVSSELRPSDRVIVSGRYFSSGVAAALAAEFVQVVGKGDGPIPLHLDAKNPPDLKWHGRLVEVVGVSVNDRTIDRNRQIAIKVGSIPALVHFAADEDGSLWPGEKPGDMVAATGVLATREPRDSSPFPFRILIGSRRELAVIDSRPWWSSQTVLQPAILASVLVLVACGWSMVLRRQVNRQAREIREQLEQETSIERRYRELFVSATDVILTHDLDGRVTSFNPAGERVLGWRAEEIIGCPIESLMAPAESNLAGGLITPEGNEITSGGRSFRLEMMARDGRVVPFEVNSWIEYQDGEPVGVQAICRDISERLRLQEEKDRFDRKLLETQKLESLGILAGGIAHDFNNLLTAVLGNASLAKIEVPEDSPAQKSIEEIEIAAERAADLCSQMLAYSGQGRFVITRLNLTTLVMETLELIQASVSKRARLELYLAERLSAVQGDATQFRQVVMNLVINGGEALGDGPGTVTVKTGEMSADPEWIRDAQIVPETWEGNYVFLEVSDTGCGMSPDTLARIFEPFFTTKFTGRGLGLAAVLGIVRSHRGALKVKSEVGSGSTFIMALPVVASASDVDRVVVIQKKAALLEGTVLVVDDEDSVRRTVTRVLQVLGCKVLAAEDGTVAVEIVRTFDKPIDLVLLDLTMPILDGVQTLRELRRIRPDLPVILMSGFAEAHALAKFGEHRLSGFLQKPFTIDEVQRRVVGVLRDRANEPVMAES
jgi:PAS domain S-box-containing protein